MRINPYEPIKAFGSFGGRCMGTLDAINQLEERDKADLERILANISRKAEDLGRTASSPELQRDFRRVRDAFLGAHAQFRLG